MLQNTYLEKIAERESFFQSSILTTGFENQFLYQLNVTDITSKSEDTSDAVTKTGATLLSWSTVLQRVPVQEVITTKTPIYRLIRQCIETTGEISKLMGFLRDEALIADIFKAALNAYNGQVRVGNPLTSTTLVLRAVKQKGKSMSTLLQRITALLLSRYLKFLNSCEPDDDWAVLIDNYDDDADLSGAVNIMLSDSYALLVEKSLPVGSSIERGFSTIYEMARDFANLHTKFHDNLLRLSMYRTDLDSLLRRLNSYIRNESEKDYGKEALIYLNDGNFLELAQNLTLIRTAANPKYASKTSTPSAVWNMEDARLTESLLGNEAMSGYRLVSRVEFIRQFDIDIITRRDGVKRAAVIIQPKIESKESTRLFTKVRSGGSNRFVYDNRLELMTSQIRDLYGARRDVTASVLSALYSNLEYDDPARIITVGVSDQDIDVLTHAFNDTYVYKLGKSGAYDFFFGVSQSNFKHIDLSYIDGLFFEGATKSSHIALLAGAIEQTASKSRYDLRDIYNFEQQVRYDIGSSRIQKLAKFDVQVNMSKEVIDATIDLAQTVLSGSVYEYVIAPRLANFIHMAAMINMIEYVRSIGLQERSHYVVGRCYTILIRAIMGYSELTYKALLSSLWTKAKPSTLVKTLYQEEDARIMAKLVALEVASSIVGEPFPFSQLVKDSDDVKTVIIDSLINN